MEDDGDIEEHLEAVKGRSLIVNLVLVLGVRPVGPAAAVCILSVLPTCGTLQYVGINTNYRFRVPVRFLLAQRTGEPISLDHP